mmetsp:Transcript_53845/g.171006  ORF Transcript_53845/g.171006 Transcript_53845/m.171006 type:complete len:240 (-) Transcript_53845:261-980(-)
MGEGGEGVAGSHVGAVLQVVDGVVAHRDARCEQRDDPAELEGLGEEVAEVGEQAQQAHLVLHGVSPGAGHVPEAQGAQQAHPHPQHGGYGQQVPEVDGYLAVGPPGNAADGAEQDDTGGVVHHALAEHHRVEEGVPLRLHHLKGGDAVGGGEDRPDGKAVVHREVLDEVEPRGPDAPRNDRERDHGAEHAEDEDPGEVAEEATGVNVEARVEDDGGEEVREEARFIEAEEVARGVAGRH